ncbi:hypothetical protein ACIRD2_22975 [Streptomyces sp. NPDC093595]|uniref:hypothetical protein n=1 Tax=Streptomyces sp. NPDC093595 TaxID=3366045 RepID=UPI0037F1B82D
MHRPSAEEPPTWAWTGARRVRQPRRTPARTAAGRTGTATVRASRPAGCDRVPRVQDNETVEVASPHDGPVAHGTLRTTADGGHQQDRQHVQHLRNRD